MSIRIRSRRRDPTIRIRSTTDAEDSRVMDRVFKFAGLDINDPDSWPSEEEVKRRMGTIFKSRRSART